VLRLAELEVDLVTRAISRNGHGINLTNQEFLLFEILKASSPEPVSNALLLERVWGRRTASRTNVVNVHLTRLRRKINRPGLPPLLHTLRGVGFALFLQI
jgi:two-component system copper resistance phosphate regulon response regulator CusR